jgi:poly-beta-1,6-N-acetyl-D-glucosamine synthase
MSRQAATREKHSYYMHALMTAPAPTGGTIATVSPPAATAPHAHVVVIVPAHNEAAQLPATIAALRRQTRIPDEIIVVSDNSTDDTVAIAHGLHVRVMTTVNNRARKAGAINQALSRILTDQGPDFCVLVMDADTELSPEWIATAARELADDPLAVVGGTYLGSLVPSAPDAGTVRRLNQGLVKQLQVNEFERASRLQGRKRRTSIWCLSGTGTMARASMLREIAAKRGDSLPGRNGEVYDSCSATEDFEITLALRSLGYRCVIPRGCRSHTEVMPTMQAWFKQRLRWQFGTLESLLAYGFNRVTWGWKGWTRQALFYLRFLGQFLLWFVLAHSLITSGTSFPPFILACLVLVYAERLISVWRVGWRGRLLAALIVPEFLYGVSEGSYLVAAIWKTGRRKPLTDWGHIS